MPRSKSAGHDVYVYVLFDWRGIPRYVGVGRRRRWTDHEQQISTYNPMKQAFIDRTLACIGEIPKVKVAEGLTRPEANELEKLFIQSIGRRPNGPLTNLTPGGDGGDFGDAISHTKSNWTPEMRERVSRNASRDTIRYWESLSQEEKDVKIKQLHVYREKYFDQEKHDLELRARRAAAVKAGHNRRTLEQKAETERKRQQSWTNEQQSALTTEWHRNMSPEAKKKRGRSISMALKGRAFPGDREKLSSSVTELWKDPEYRDRQLRNRRDKPSGLGTIWITNGITSRRVSPEDPIPEGWRRGKRHRVPE